MHDCYMVYLFFKSSAGNEQIMRIMLTVFIRVAYRNCKIYVLLYSMIQKGMCSRLYEQILNFHKRYISDADGG